MGRGWTGIRGWGECLFSHCCCWWFEYSNGDSHYIKTEQSRSSCSVNFTTETPELNKVWLPSHLPRSPLPVFICPGGKNTALDVGSRGPWFQCYTLTAWPRRGTLLLCGRQRWPESPSFAFTSFGCTLPTLVLGWTARLALNDGLEQRGHCRRADATYLPLLLSELWLPGEEARVGPQGDDVCVARCPAVWARHMREVILVSGSWLPH